MRQLIVIKVSFVGHTRSLFLSLLPPSPSLLISSSSQPLFLLFLLHLAVLFSLRCPGRGLVPLSLSTASHREPSPSVILGEAYSLSSSSVSPLLLLRSLYHHLRRCSRPLPPPLLSRFWSFWKTPRKCSRGTFWDQCCRGCPTSRYTIVATAVRADASRFLNFPPVQNPPEIRAISYVLSEKSRLWRRQRQQL